MPKVLPLYILSGLVALVAVYSGLTGNAVWFIKDTRMAVIVLAGAGFMMCSTGVITTFVTKAPAHPLTILTYLLGALALFAGLVQLCGWSVPMLSDSRTALIVITIVIVMKAVIGRFGHLIAQ